MSAKEIFSNKISKGSRTHFFDIKKSEEGTTGKAYSVEKIRETYRQAYTPWSIEDDNKLELLFSQGKTVEELSRMFERNDGAISSRINKLKLKEKYGKFPPLLH